ncbi:MAG: hypothetical protein ACJAZO_001800 [Myxococcota bacterium]|jgi:hypothetical protein
MRTADVKAWRDRLLALPVPESHLSSTGAQEVWHGALQALTNDALDAIDDGPAYPTAVLICARTVLTAPLEWCAVLLARGTSVTLKVPSSSPGWTQCMVDAAAHVGLPLTATTARAVVADAELVVAMGTDETMDAVRPLITGAFIELGHRFSVAYVTKEWNAVAEDAARHDGRGCFSPAVVFSSDPKAVEYLAGAMTAAQKRWPIGEVSPIEAATARARGALARVTGRSLSGDGWSVHQLPVEHLEPTALPRSLTLIQVASEQGAVDIIARFGRWLSCVSTDGDATLWERLNPSRIVASGELQRPVLHRIHDGLDWIRATRP